MRPQSLVHERRGGTSRRRSAVQRQYETRERGSEISRAVGFHRDSRLRRFAGT